MAFLGSGVLVTFVKGSKLLPVFYFEGDVDHSQCLVVKSWDWAYLRFCCKVQGVKDELIVSVSCEVIELEVLKNYFLIGTTFMEYWPARDFINRVKSKTNIPPGSWKRIVTIPGDRKWLGNLNFNQGISNTAIQCCAIQGAGCCD